MIKMSDFDVSISLHPPPQRHTQEMLLEISTNLEDPLEPLQISRFL